MCIATGFTKEKKFKCQLLAQRIQIPSQKHPSQFLKQGNIRNGRIDKSVLQTPDILYQHRVKALNHPTIHRCASLVWGPHCAVCHPHYKTHFYMNNLVMNQFSVKHCVNLIRNPAGMSQKHVAPSKNCGLLICIGSFCESCYYSIALSQFNRKCANHREHGNEWRKLFDNRLPEVLKLANETYMGGELANCSVV